MRDEIKFTYTDCYGRSFEAYRVGRNFAVREFHDRNVYLNKEHTKTAPTTHGVVWLCESSYPVLPMPSAELAWFFADELAINFDERASVETMPSILEETREWATHVVTQQDFVPYRHWRLQERAHAN